jgi:RNA polymerase sigma-70 factor (ECF subfamily)
VNLIDLDAVLVAEARRGSSQAFDRLVAKHQQAVRGFLRRLIGDWADADDLAQDTFVAAWAGLGGYKAVSSVRSWLCAIAWRKAQSHQRSRGRGAARDGAWLRAAAAPAGPEAEELIALAKALADLPMEQRAAVSLCLAAEFSHAEAAEALGLPLGTIKSHVTRGRAKLLEVLGDGDDQS